MKQTLFLILGLAVLAVIVTFAADALRPTGKEVTQSPLAAYFEERLTTLGVADIGQPIEGFDANLLIMAFPGIEPVDFEGVEAIEGYYRVSDGQIELVRTEGAPVSSAERMVSVEGYKTLLANLSARLAMQADSEAAIDALIDRINTAERITAQIDQGGSAFGIKVVPLAVLEDSRCPRDAQCIQAGTVRVRTEFESAAGTREQVFELGKPVVSETEEVTLIQVSPDRVAGERIAAPDYRFVFEVRKR